MAGLPAAPAVTAVDLSELARVTCGASVAPLLRITCVSARGSGQWCWPDPSSATTIAPTEWGVLELTGPVAAHGYGHGDVTV